MALGENIPEFRQATTQFQVMHALTTGMSSEGETALLCLQNTIPLHSFTLSCSYSFSPTLLQRSLSFERKGLWYKCPIQH